MPAVRVRSAPSWRLRTRRIRSQVRRVAFRGLRTDPSEGDGRRLGRTSIAHFPDHARWTQKN
jgi:hypothetical protein